MSDEHVEHQHLTHALDPVLDLRAAPGLKDRLRHLLDRGQPLTIDAGQVARISTACIQVISAFVLAARSSGLPLAFEPLSPAFAEAFACLGLSGVITERHT